MKHASDMSYFPHMFNYGHNLSSVGAETLVLLQRFATFLQHPTEQPSCACALVIAAMYCTKARVQSTCTILILWYCQKIGSFFM